MCSGLIRWLHSPAAKVLKKRRRVNNFIARAGYTGTILAEPLALKYFNLFCNPAERPTWEVLEWISTCIKPTGIREHFYMSCHFSQPLSSFYPAVPEENTVTLQAPASWFYCVLSLWGQELLSDQKLFCLLHTKSPKLRGCYILQEDAEALTSGNRPQTLKGCEQVKFPIISMYRPGKWAAALKSGFLKFCWMTTTSFPSLPRLVHIA